MENQHDRCAICGGLLRWQSKGLPGWVHIDGGGQGSGIGLVQCPRCGAPLRDHHCALPLVDETLI